MSLADPEAFELINEAVRSAGTPNMSTVFLAGTIVIQLPEDMMKFGACYELKPDVIVETGLSWKPIFMRVCTIGKGRVIGIDIEIRSHNRSAIEEHRLSPMIQLVEGSSTAPEVVKRCVIRLVLRESPCAS